MKKSVSSKGMINFNLLSEPPLPLSLSLPVLRNVVSQAARIKFTLNRVSRGEKEREREESSRVLDRFEV